MWVLAGPGIKQDELLFGTSILDLAPTLLHHMGMAVGRDMDGRVLTGAFEDPGDVDFIESWERVDGPDGRHPPDIWTGPLDEVSSGNAGLAPVDDPVWLASAGLRLGRAKSLIEAGDGAEAVPILHDLWRTDPSEPHYGDILIGCLLGLGRADLAHAALERLFAHRKRHAPAALKAWRELDRRDPDTLTSAERGRKAQLWKRSRSNIAGMAVLRAQILSVDGKVAEALQAIEAIDPDKVHDRPGLLRLKADCLARLERWDEAEALYTGLHEEDPDDPDNILHLARFAFDRKRFAEAANLALRSVGLRYYNPMAHYTYATSIFHCGQPQKAADALKVAVSQDPHMIPAYDRLTALYGGPLRDPQQAEIYHQRAQRAAAHRRADQEAREAALGAFMRETAEEWGLATKP